MSVGKEEKPIAWLGCEIKTPPVSLEARLEAGALLGRLQQGESLGMPYSRPMSSIGPRCHELRVRDAHHYWRIVYRLDKDVIIAVYVFPKKTQDTPQRVIDECRRRLALYDGVANQARKKRKP
jgi:phage-related protein